MAFGTMLAVILFAVMRISPRRWWLQFWFPAVAVVQGLKLVEQRIYHQGCVKITPKKISTAGNQNAATARGLIRITAKRITASMVPNAIPRNSPCSSPRQEPQPWMDCS